MPTNHQELTLQPSTFETIDTALVSFINSTLDIRVETNKGFEKVPVIWASSERAYQIKQNKDLRNQEGIVTLPLIVVSRDSVTRPQDGKGGVPGWIPGGYLSVSKRVQQDKTSNFLNADSKRTYGQVNFKVAKQNNKVVYQHISVPQPIYVKIGYKILLLSEYRQQINDMILPFLAKPGSLNQVFIYNAGHRYEAFLRENYANVGSDDNLKEESRLFKCEAGIDVLGYTMGADASQAAPKILIEENAVEIRMLREQPMITGVTSMRPYAGGPITGSAANGT